MIFVTGGTGFIGRELVKILASKYDPKQIVCLAHKDSSSQLEITGREVLRQAGVEMVEAELMTGEGLERLKGRTFDIVFHLASCTDTSEPDHSINDVGTKNLMTAIGPLSPKTHMVFTSSIAVNDMRADFDAPINEDTPVPERPCHEYGRKKLMTEKYLKALAQEQKFSLSVIRVCGVYGDNVRKGGLFNSIEDLMLKDSWIGRWNWPGKVGLIYVKDMAAFIECVSRKKPASGSSELYIPAVEALSMQEMVETVYQAYGRTYRPVKLPSIFWGIGKFFARRKRCFEAILPHRWYNRFWQACLLVNNEFCNKGRRIQEVFGSHQPKTFAEFYRERAQRVKA